MIEDTKRIDPEEFRQEGYLQEVNRLFLHPLGLALEVVTDETGKATAFGGVWDYREDPEGMCYAGEPDPDKAENVARQRSKLAQTRRAALGYVVQPTGRKVYEPKA